MTRRAERDLHASAQESQSPGQTEDASAVSAAASSERPASASANWGNRSRRTVPGAAPSSTTTTAKKGAVGAATATNQRVAFEGFGASVDLADHALRIEIEVNKITVLKDRLRHFVEECVVATPELRGCRVEAVGSTSWGGSVPQSDLDLVLFTPSADAVGAQAVSFLAALRRGLQEKVEASPAEANGLWKEMELLDAPRVPILRLLDGLVPCDVTVDQHRTLRHRAALQRTLEGRPALRHFTRLVKYWLRRRGLPMAAEGGIPSLAWAVVAIRLAEEQPLGSTVEALLMHFFQHMSNLGEWSLNVEHKPDGTARLRWEPRLPQQSEWMQLFCVDDPTTPALSPETGTSASGMPVAAAEPLGITPPSIPTALGLFYIAELRIAWAAAREGRWDELLRQTMPEARLSLPCATDPKRRKAPLHLLLQDGKVLVGRLREVRACPSMKEREVLHRRDQSSVLVLDPCSIVEATWSIGEGKADEETSVVQPIICQPCHWICSLPTWSGIKVSPGDGLNRLQEVLRIARLAPPLAGFTQKPEVFANSGKSQFRPRYSPDPNSSFSSWSSQVANFVPEVKTSIAKSNLALARQQHHELPVAVAPLIPVWAVPAAAVRGGYQQMLQPFFMVGGDLGAQHAYCRSCALNATSQQQQQQQLCDDCAALRRSMGQYVQLIPVMCQLMPPSLAARNQAGAGNGNLLAWSSSAESGGVYPTATSSSFAGHGVSRREALIDSVRRPYGGKRAQQKQDAPKADEHLLTPVATDSTHGKGGTPVVVESSRALAEARSDDSTCVSSEDDLTSASGVRAGKRSSPGSSAASSNGSSGGGKVCNAASENRSLGGGGGGGMGHGASGGTAGLNSRPSVGSCRRGVVGDSRASSEVSDRTQYQPAPPPPSSLDVRSVEQAPPPPAPSPAHCALAASLAQDTLESDGCVGTPQRAPSAPPAPPAPAAPLPAALSLAAPLLEVPSPLANLASAPPPPLATPLLSPATLVGPLPSVLAQEATGAPHDSETLSSGAASAAAAAEAPQSTARFQLVPAPRLQAWTQQASPLSKAQRRKTSRKVADDYDASSYRWSLVCALNLDTPTFCHLDVRDKGSKCRQ